MISPSHDLRGAYHSCLRLYHIFCLFSKHKGARLVTFILQRCRAVEVIHNSCALLGPQPVWVRRNLLEVSQHLKRRRASCGDGWGWGRRSLDLRGTAGARGVQLISRRENKAAFGPRAGLISQPRAEASGGRRLLDYYSAGRAQQQRQRQQRQPVGVLPRGRCQVSQ